jgi:hypothetical protein
MAKRSFRLTWKVAVRDSDLPPIDKLVAFVLGSHMNQDGWCFLSLETIAREASLSVATVKRHLGQGDPLLQSWLLKVSGGRGRGGRTHASEFQAVLPTEKPAQSEPVSEPATRQETGSLRPETGAESHVNRRRVSPQLVMNSSLELGQSLPPSAAADAFTKLAGTVGRGSPVGHKALRRETEADIERRRQLARDAKAAELTRVAAASAP